MTLFYDTGPSYFLARRSEHAVTTAGLLQVEGKDYIVADADIMHVRFNV